MLAQQIIYLQVFHWIPVMLYKDDCISPSEIQAKTSNMSSEEQDIDRWIVVKSDNNKKAPSGDKRQKLTNEKPLKICHYQTPSKR